MNAERLHALVLALERELSVTNEADLLGQLSSALNSAVGQPSEPAYQQQVVDSRIALGVALGAASSNGFSAGMRRAVEELGVANLLGGTLRNRIDVIFAGNEITPAVAATEVESIAGEVRNLAERLAELHSAFEFFNVGAEDLALGEFEVGFLIPRAAVRSELKPLGLEFADLQDIMAPVQELATGTVENLTVRAIGSSDFQVLLEMLPQVANMIAEILDALATTFEKIKRLKAIWTSGKEEDVPDEVLAPLQTHVNGILDVDVNAIAQKLIEEHRVNLRGDGREHEVQMKLTRSIRQLANRIDDQYTIEVRSYELPPPAEDEVGLPEGVTEQTEQARRSIEELQPRIQSLNLGGPPILHELETGNGETGDAEDAGSGEDDTADESD